MKLKYPNRDRKEILIPTYNEMHGDDQNPIDARQPQVVSIMFLLAPHTTAKQNKVGILSGSTSTRFQSPTINQRNNDKKFSSIKSTHD